MALFGFIGTGNMGGALASAVSRKCGAAEILLANRTPVKAEALAAALGAKATDNATVAASCTYLFLGVKPQGMAALLTDLAPILKARTDRFVLVTMAAGLSMETITAMADITAPVIRIMPNTPVSVGEGIILCTANALVTTEELAVFTDALSLAGIVDLVTEAELDAAGVISGCGPAFMFQFIKAMEDAGVSLGLSSDKARLYAEQTMCGAAHLALATGKDPEDLKIAVCSPGGTTIEGVKRFENGGLSTLVSEAVAASYRRTLELAGKI